MKKRASLKMSAEKSVMKRHRQRIAESEIGLLFSVILDIILEVTMRM
jgi:hypothetical protein